MIRHYRHCEGCQIEESSKPAPHVGVMMWWFNNFLGVEDTDTEGKSTPYIANEVWVDILCTKDVHLNNLCILIIPKIIIFNSDLAGALFNSHISVSSFYKSLRLGRAQSKDLFTCSKFMKSCLPKWTSSPRWARCVFFCSLMIWGSTQIWSKTWEEIRWLTGPGQSWKETDVGNPFYIMKIIWKARWSWTKLAIKNLFSWNKMGDPLSWSSPSSFEIPSNHRRQSRMA